MSDDASGSTHAEADGDRQNRADTPNGDADAQGTPGQPRIGGRGRLILILVGVLVLVMARN